MSTPADEFASLLEARIYVDGVRERMGLHSTQELLDALDRVDRAHEEFPELAIEHPRPCLTSMLNMLPASDGETLIRLLGRVREIRWDAIEPVVSALRRQGRAATILQIVSAVLDRLTFSGKENATAFGKVFADLLADDRRLAIDYEQLARSARRRMKEPAPGRPWVRPTQALLALAERLRIAEPPAPAKPRPGRAWPSGRLSFDEFLLQWPCEIELPADLGDAAFIDEAHRAILLREPEVVEREQYLRLLRDAAVSREWIIEDLLASEELHSLERRLRVVCDGRVITGPGAPGREDMPAVTWPAWPVG